MKYLIGIDIGTQGTRGALFDDAGTCLADATVSSKLNRPKPGIVEEDPERQVRSVCQTIRQCVEKAKVDSSNVAGIGIDGQMAGVIGIGKDGHAVTPYDSWLDTRCAPYIREMEKAAGDEVVRKSGGPASFNHGPKILWWLKERRSDYRKIAVFVQPSGYAAMRLSGLKANLAFIDHTYLHFSGFADNRRRRWDASLCKTFGVDQGKLPRIVEPQQVVGELTNSAARRCGLRQGVPVVAGCGDTAASFLSCGAVHEGVCVDVAGTASVFAATTTAFKADVKERTLGMGQSAVPGLWHPYAYISGGGMNLEWLRRELEDGACNFDQLGRLAARSKPVRDGVMFVPHLGGRSSPPQPQLRGAWVGLTWSATRGQLYRAVLESIALEYAIYRRVLMSLYRNLKLRELRVTGGGEKSRIWNRIKADALQLPVRRIVDSHGAPMGAAMIAGHGVGILQSLPIAAKSWVKLGETTRHARRMATHYNHRRRRYESLLNMLEGVVM